VTAAAPSFLPLAPRVPVGLIHPLALPDGRRLLVRPVLPQDDEAEQAFVMALSAASRYRRFHVGVRALPAATLARLTQIDHRSHVALVAQPLGEFGDDDEAAIVADARYVLTGPDSAEFAVAVADDWQRQGVGRSMLCLLARHAARHGITRLTGDVLLDNAPMLAMMRGIGSRLVLRDDEPGLVLATMELADAPQARCAAASSSRV
jgi:acetyltransferase